MLRSTAKKLLDNGVLHAWANGKTIQMRIQSTDTWQDLDFNRPVAFSAEADDYRIKPEPRTVPLEAQDIPPVCWLREKGKSTRWLIWQISETEVRYGVNSVANFGCLRTHFEYSSDCVNWFPCEKKVD